MPSKAQFEDDPDFYAQPSGSNTDVSFYTVATSNLTGAGKNLGKLYSAIGRRLETITDKVFNPAPSPRATLRKTTALLSKRDLGSSQKEKLMKNIKLLLEFARSENLDTQIMVLGEIFLLVRTYPKAADAMRASGGLAILSDAFFHASEAAQKYDPLLEKIQRAMESLCSSINEQTCWEPPKSNIKTIFPTFPAAQTEELQFILDEFEGLGALKPSHAGQRILLHRLKHMELRQTIHGELQGAVWRGPFSDVFRAVMHDYPTQTHSTTVAIKRVRICFSSLKDYDGNLNTFLRELRIWAELRHQNILPLLGYRAPNTSDVFPTLISQWMDNGTLWQLMSDNKDKRFVHFAHGIARGLEYLHDRQIVHSDLKSANIFISSEGEPLLADFGISQLLIQTNTVANTAELKYSIRWTARELLDYERTDNVTHTFESDIWAYGMVIYELLSKDLPYAHLHHDAPITLAIWENQLPPIAEYLSGSWGAFEYILWNLCNLCWRQIPTRRPSMRAIVCILEGFSM